MTRLIEAAMALLSEPRSLISLGLSLLASAVLAVLMAKRLGASSTLVFLLLSSLGLVLTTMFVSGRGGGWPTTVDPSVLAGCVATPRLGSWDLQAYLNLILYLPLSLFAVLVFRKFLAVVASCTLLALLLEAFQGLINAGVCESSDVVRNLAGILVGAGIAWPAGRIGGLNAS